MGFDKVSPNELNRTVLRSDPPLYMSWIKKVDVEPSFGTQPRGKNSMCNPPVFGTGIRTTEGKPAPTIIEPDNSGSQSGSALLSTGAGVVVAGTNINGARLASQTYAA